MCGMGADWALLRSACKQALPSVVTTAVLAVSLDRAGNTAATAYKACCLQSEGCQRLSASARSAPAYQHTKKPKQKGSHSTCISTLSPHGTEQTCDAHS